MQLCVLSATLFRLSFQYKPNGVRVDFEMKQCFVLKHLKMTNKASCET